MAITAWDNIGSRVAASCILSDKLAQCQGIDTCLILWAEFHFRRASHKAEQHQTGLVQQSLMEARASGSAICPAYVPHHLEVHIGAQHARDGLRINGLVEGMAKLLGVRNTVQRQSCVWC